MHRSRRSFVLLSAAAAAGHAQMLSRPGWRGTGLAPEAWWKHAAFVRFPADISFAAALGMLDAMSEVGADSMLLPDPAPEPSAPLPFASRFGTEDDLDALLRETSARRMHVLFAADVSRLAAATGEVRFWMSRGVGGFDVGVVGPADVGSVHILGASLSRFAGQRILLEHLSGFFPGNTYPELHPFPCTVLDYAVNDYIGAPSQGFVVDMYANEHVSRHLQSAEIPVFDGTALSSADLRFAMRDWLALRRNSMRRSRR